MKDDKDFIAKVHLPSTNFSFREMDHEALQQLYSVLEKVEEGRSTLVRLADLMGGAVGQVMQMGGEGLAFFPQIEEKVKKLAEFSLKTAYKVAILGVEKKKKSFLPTPLRENMTQAFVAVSGAMGGFGGFLSLAPDVGLTTMAIMYEIANIAKENGEDLRSEETQRACLEVFALRNFVHKKPTTRQANIEQPQKPEEHSEEKELGFFAARSLMRGQPLVLLIAEVAGQYGIGLSRKFAAQMVPVAGALCGAAINSAFLAHYRAIAQAHFTIRRLERIHGAAVQEAAEAYQTGVLKNTQEF